jgi:hypothetical protein
MERAMTKASKELQERLQRNGPIMRTVDWFIAEQYHLERIGDKEEMTPLEKAFEALIRADFNGEPWSTNEPIGPHIRSVK